MDDAERYGVWVGLREMNGWKYLGGGRWEEPEWLRKTKTLDHKQPKVLINPG